MTRWVRLNREAGQAIEARQRLQDAKLRAETQKVVAPLEADRQRWRELYAELVERQRELDEELARVIDQANRDAPLRAWAKFFQIVSLSASLAQQFVPESPPPEAAATGQTPPETAPADQTPTDSTPPQDGLHIHERYQRVIEVCEDGTCQPIDMRQFINETTKPLAGIKDAAVSQMSGQLHQTAARLPSLRCDLGGERCWPLDTGSGTAIVPADSSPAVPPPGRPAMPPPSTTPSSSWEKQAFSFLIDLAPVSGSVKSAVEMVSGKDPVTGEQVNRIVAAAGIVAGAFPGGKALIKVVKHGSKYNKIKGPRAFRHYTSRKNSNAIAQEGTIKTNEQNTVYAVRTRERIWSRADAEDTLGLRQGRGRDYVEFDLPQGNTAKEVYNPVTQRKEWKISGDIRLDPARAVVVQRD